MVAAGPCPSGQPRGTPPSAASEAQWNMAGAQYDFDAGNRYTGQYYEQGTGRGIVAWKGQVVRTEAGKNPRLLATVGDDAAVNAIYKPDEWNELHIIAVGTHMTHLLNGRVISILDRRRRDAPAQDGHHRHRSRSQPASSSRETSG